MDVLTRRVGIALGGLAVLSLALAQAQTAAGPANDGANADKVAPPLRKTTLEMLREGQQTFRHDTFGDEAFWGGELGLHLAIAGESQGGVGPGLGPQAALDLGLKVDRRALTPAIVGQLSKGQLDLDDPANTVALLSLDAVLGVKGFFDEQDQLVSVGIQCALCHSTVDDSLAPGIGRRLDGWANRDLDVGTIISLAPDLSPFAQLLGVTQQDVKDVLTSWGPGKFDAALVLDGKAFQPDGDSAATLIPPIFGLAGVNLHTFTGWGSVPYWNAFVAVLEMHGQGTFFDPRLDDAAKFPIAAANGLGHVVPDGEDLVTPKLAALHLYQLSLVAPTAPVGSFDPQAAERGALLFEGKAQCATCHVQPLYTDPGWNLHTGAEIGIDDFQSSRSPDGGYRTTPLKGLWSHQKGGFYHDGRFATLPDVIEHYDGVFDLGLTPAEQGDLVQFLLSI